MANGRVAAVDGDSQFATLDQNDFGARGTFPPRGEGRGERTALGNTGSFCPVVRNLNV